MYRMVEELKEELKNPLGKVILEDELLDEIGNAEVIVSIGDMCTLTLNEFGIKPKISIIDFQIERKSRKELKEKFSSNSNIKVNNPRGYITDELWDAIEMAYKKENNTIIEVNGEEDLATLPAVILAPKSSIVVYGLPKKGIVIVDTNEEVKEKVKKVLKKMEV